MNGELLITRDQQKSATRPKRVRPSQAAGAQRFSRPERELKRSGVSVDAVQAHRCGEGALRAVAARVSARLKILQLVR